VQKVLRPKPREFDVDKHSESLSKLTENMSEKKFEKACESVALDILKNYEGFQKVEKGPNFLGTPFDFFGFKNGSPYIIELKSSLNHFNAPGETQKRRLKELLESIAGLKVALLQVKLRKGEYRMFYDEEMEILFQERRAPLEPIEDWIKERLRAGGRTKPSLV
jgi:hypothetical protein